MIVNKEGYYNRKTNTFVHITENCTMDCNPKSYKYILELEEEVKKLNHIIDKQDKDITVLSKGNSKLKSIIDDLQQKHNFAENILYDYLYKDKKITKEVYDKFKEGKGDK